MAYDNTNKFFIGANTKQREGKNDPTHNGTINVDGKEFYLNGWLGEKDGKKFISGSIKPKTGGKPKSSSGKGEDF